MSTELPKTLDDQDFVHYCAVANQMAVNAASRAEQLGDHKQEHFYIGVARGIRMAQEGYEQCLRAIREARALENLEKAEGVSTTFVLPYPPA